METLHDQSGCLLREGNENGLGGEEPPSLADMPELAVRKTERMMPDPKVGIEIGLEKQLHVLVVQSRTALRAKRRRRVERRRGRLRNLNKHATRVALLKTLHCHVSMANSLVNDDAADCRHGHVGMTEVDATNLTELPNNWELTRMCVQFLRVRRK